MLLKDGHQVASGNTTGNPKCVDPRVLYFKKEKVSRLVRNYVNLEKILSSA